MINYKNSKIYKLINTTTNKVYYGSTTQDLKTRLREHRSKRNRINRETSKLLFNDNGNVIIELVEEVECNNKKELFDRERFYIENNECVNKHIPNRTMSEYYQDNKKKIQSRVKEYMSKPENYKRKIDYMKQYSNTEERKQKVKEYKQEEILCECGTIIKKCRKARHIKTDKHINLMNKNIV